MVPSQAPQKNFYFCANAVQIHTHTVVIRTHGLSGVCIITFKPEYHNRTITNHNDIHSPMKMSAKFPHTI